MNDSSGKATQAGERPTLLIVDDDPLITDSLSLVLGRDYDVLVAESRPHALDLLRQRDEAPMLALVDLGLPPIPHRPDEGFTLIADLLAQSRDIKILVLSGQSDEANARHARALGAVDFIPKPCEPQKLKAHLARALQVRDIEIGKDSGTALDADLGIIGRSPPVQKMREQIMQYAKSPFPVLIEGESGSGKELVANCLHRLSSRASSPYFALNCAAISPTLVEPTLFGYAKGAFTGSAGPKSGYFEDAADGTLFLDEIGELPVDLQAKLLRVLENGEFQRVGETQTRKSHARVIAATNRDLRQEIRGGRFRADLYHRLSVFTIAVPPLRDLGADKLLLLEHFRRFYASQGQSAPFELDADARGLWERYAFPGNVRELRNIVIRLATKHAGAGVNRARLEAELDLETGPRDETGAALSGDSDTLLDIARRHLQRAGEFRLDEVLGRWEASYIEAALRITRGNVSQAARLLGVNRTTLYSRMDAAGREPKQD
ncbi:MAG TPA: sigma-54 dependent transcriptional regulator [Burkholderiales bacterium]|nr:sigma-54 dependent transcriptional regulator [Burkholderiales bacterium]